VRGNAPDPDERCEALKSDLQAKLNIAVLGRGGTDLPETSRVGIRSGVTEVGMVQRIERLSPELYADPFSHPKVLEQAENNACPRHNQAAWSAEHVLPCRLYS
jgi:hypothetical protein